MIKTKIIEKEVKEYFCDYCSNPASTGLRKFQQCLFCDKIICSKCCWWDESPFSSDCHDTYCLRCWHTGEYIREEIQDIEKEANKKVEQLRNKWKETCLR